MKKENEKVPFLKEYSIEGEAKFNGNKENISEIIKDYSTYLAFKHLAERLRKQRKQLVEFYKCRIRTIKILLPKKTPIKFIKKKEKREKQLEMFEIYSAP